MKKLAVLICVLMLLAAPCALAEANYTALCGGVPVLNVSYDPGVFSLDTESYLYSTMGDHYWLGMFYNGSDTVEFSADRYPDLNPGSDINQLSAYLTAALAAEQCAPLEIYTNPGFISFALFSLNGSMGPSYYAALLSQGYVVHFEIYNLRGGAGPEALNTLKTLLDGVRW